MSGVSVHHDRNIQAAIEHCMHACDLAIREGSDPLHVYNAMAERMGGMLVLHLMERNTDIPAAIAIFSCRIEAIAKEAKRLLEEGKE